LGQGRFEGVLASAGDGDDYYRARALAGLKRFDEVEALLTKSDLRRFPAVGGTELAVALERAGSDAPALVLLEWAIVSGGPTAERSALAAELRARQSNLKGLLGMEGIQRLISGRYVNLSFLGQGGMGIVLKGDDTFLGRPVALKVLNPSLLSDPGSRARFRREVETMMTLNHPAIIEIHAVHSEDLLYFAMEYLEGASLREALQEDAGTVDRERALREVAAAMAYCHEQGILHRDLKADNVFLLKDGRVKLIDFGIARAMGGTDLTAQGELVGTLGYLAPELFRGGQASSQADVFAFGVMAYDVYAGRLPFAHPLSMGTIVPPPEMPFGLQAVMLRCLAADPAERFGSFREVQAALATF
jgi:serine/threonine-protein kinase